MATDPLPKQQKLILEALQSKAQIKTTVYDQSLEVFNELKEVLSEISNDLNDILSESETSRRIRLEYRDRGKFEPSPTASRHSIPVRALAVTASLWTPTT